MISPIAPFITDDIYTKLTGEVSVHLSDYPVFDESKVNLKIENRMDLVKDLISLGRNAREEAKIKVRQPISKAILDGKNEKLISDLSDLIKEELNVKEVIFEKELNKYMSLEVKPNYRLCGKMFGKNINAYANKLNELSEEDVSKLQNNENISVDLDGEKVEVT